MDRSRREALVPVALVSASRDLVLAYLFTRHGGTEIADARIRLRVRDGTYQIEFFRPADGSIVGGPPQEDSPGLRQPITISLPRFTDDLAMRITRVGGRERTLIPGTK